jgi:hypothetical protein
LSDEQLSFLDEECDTAHVDFIPTREAGLERLKHFAPYTGRAYAAGRNFDLGADNRSNISALSPWIRHRLISEEEVLRETLKQHSLQASEKFVQEVFWRAYFKGWLEQKPDVWRWYNKDLKSAIKVLGKDKNLRQRYEEAIAGNTGIDAFDHWAKELTETGYLHNHARMWFASIWIFTLKLPWELGADFFYRHLLDGDPASNTCSWRWVGGLHTKGKNYAARASNISKFTNGRFSGHMNLASDPMPLSEMREADSVPLPIQEGIEDKSYILLLTEEDLLPETLALRNKPKAILGMLSTEARSPLEVSAKIIQFTQSAMVDALERAKGHFGCETTFCDKEDDQLAFLVEAAKENDVDTIVTAYAPIGPVADRLAQIQYKLGEHDIKLVQVMRDYDAKVWPHATRGFFKVKKQIPKLIDQLNIS